MKNPLVLLNFLLIIALVYVKKDEKRKKFVDFVFQSYCTCILKHLAVKFLQAKASYF